MMFEVEKSVLFEARAPATVSGAASVTVTVTSFNYARFVRECLKSVASQTYRNLEIVVVDDRSTNKFLPSRLRLAKNALGPVSADNSCDAQGQSRPCSGQKYRI